MLRLLLLLLFVFIHCYLFVFDGTLNWIHFFSRFFIFLPHSFCSIFAGIHNIFTNMKMVFGFAKVAEIVDTRINALNAKMNEWMERKPPDHRIGSIRKNNKKKTWKNKMKKKRNTLKQRGSLSNSLSVAVCIVFYHHECNIVSPTLHFLSSLST